MLEVGAVMTVPPKRSAYYLFFSFLLKALKLLVYTVELVLKNLLEGYGAGGDCYGAVTLLLESVEVLVKVLKLVLKKLLERLWIWWCLLWSWR